MIAKIVTCTSIIYMISVTLLATRFDQSASLEIFTSTNHLELVWKPFRYVLRGQIGLTINKNSDVHFRTCNTEDVCFQRIEQNITSTVTITHEQKGNVQCKTVTHFQPPSQLKDCFDLGSAHWYGGGEVFNQTFPIRKESRPRNPYVTGDFFHRPYGGLIENLWFNSEGFSLFVDRQTPLFVSYNESGDGQICFSASYDEYPFTVAGQRNASKILNYTICSAEDVLQVYNHTAQSNLRKPTGVPEPTMFSSPIWSTWVKYKASVNQEMVLDFARGIQSQNYSGQIEIDDMWETCYGQLEFNKVKFPDPKTMVANLHSMGFRVSLWIHPFANVFCDAYKDGKEKNYFVRNATTGITQKVKWWDGYGGYLDPTNPEGVEWFFQRVDRIRQDYGFDTFKFDAGEIEWNDPGFDFANRGLRMFPSVFSMLYAELASRFGNGVEVRVGYNAQHLPIWVRMLDKSSSWGYDNGLKSLIPTALLFGVSGYPFVLPDMIGGNNYGEYPEKELFIRWMQANVFLPSVQFSILPWDYDDETATITSAMFKIHQEYVPLMLELANESISTVNPIVRPLWWAAPTDAVALGIDSEFLVGNDLLVAPVLEKGARSRNIYLPSGSWIDANNPQSVLIGPKWINDYKAELNILPYFMRVKST